MKTVNIPVDLLEQVTIELEHDTDRYMLGRDLRKLLAEQPQADHSAQDLNMVEQPQAGAGQDVLDALDWVDDFVARCNGDDRGSCESVNILRQALTNQPPARHDQGDEVRRLREALESKVPLYEAVERACGELPDGWAITLQMENGAGWVELYDAEGNQVEDFPTNNERLDYTLNDAIDAALTQSPKGEEE